MPNPKPEGRYANLTTRKCGECVFWRDRHVMEWSGKRRPYRDSEKDPVTGWASVGTSIGANVSPQCWYDYLYSDGAHKPVFRNADDYCSRFKQKGDR